MLYMATVHSLNGDCPGGGLAVGCFLVGATDHSVNEPRGRVKRKKNVGDEAQIGDLLTSTTRARTEAVRGTPPAHVDGCRADAVLHPGAAHNPEAPREPAAHGSPYAAMRRDPVDGEGLDMASAGDRAEISAEALVLETTSGTTPLALESVTAPSEAPTSDLDELDTDSSPDNGQMAPDLGERV